MDSFAIGADLGGSHLSIGLVDQHGRILDYQEIKIDNLASPEITLDILAGNASRMKEKHENVKALGIGLPGNHDSVKGICRFSPNFPQWHHVEVAPYLSRVLKMPVYMLNDVRVATLGELYFGAGKGVKNLVMLAIGTGVGGGVVINGSLVIGNEEAAGEIGHMTIDLNGPLCNCGNYGCLEAFASGPSIAAHAAEAIIRKQSVKLREKIKSLEEISAKIIAEAAGEGDSAAFRILEQAGRAIGTAVANLAVTLNPERFIIGGGVAQAGEPLFSGIRKELEKRLKIIQPESISVLPAALGVKAGLVGAAAYAFLKSEVMIL
ncbi:MAG: ROK family protein [Firmicutes bacterium]|nr:ROK family protein [Bacillota bacterium]